MAGGFLKSHRKMLDNPLFQGRVDWLGAWIWLLHRACWKETKFDIKGRVVTLQRGQLCWSTRDLAKEFGWSKSATDRFLTRLKTETMIGTDGGTSKNIITICNYERYQGEDDSLGTDGGTVIGTTSGHKRRREEKKKKGSASSLRSETGDLPLSEIIFGQGLRFLQKSGVPEKSARSMLGKWRKNYGDEHLLAALGKAQREGALDPVAFCEGIFRHVNGKPEPKTASDHIRAELRAQDEAKAAGVGR